MDGWRDQKYHRNNKYWALTHTFTFINIYWYGYTNKSIDTNAIIPNDTVETVYDEQFQLFISYYEWVSEYEIQDKAVKMQHANRFNLYDVCKCLNHY